MNKILATGANSFVGKNIYKHLIKLNYLVREILNWIPPVSVDEPIKRMAKDK